MVSDVISFASGRASEARVIQEWTPSGLELLRCRPERATGAPVLFVHGAFSGAWCWAEHFLEAFAAAGHPAWAVSLRGHGASAGRDRLAHHSLGDYVSDLREAMRVIGEPVALVGHSMGGFVIQKLLEGAGRDLGAIRGAALVASVPPTGLALPAAWMVMTRPDLYARLALMVAGGPKLAAAMAGRALRRSLFATLPDDAQVERYLALFHGESSRVVLDMNGFDPLLPWCVSPSVPMLILGAEKDDLVPRPLVATTALIYQRSFQMIPGLAHVVMLEAEWERAAAPILTWLQTLKP